MASAKDIMGGGFSAAAAAAINGQVSSAITAAGTTQSDATALVASINVVTTAAASTGVLLPNTEIGDEYEVLNLGASALTVYPPTSGQINQLSANTGFSLAPNTAVKVRKYTSTKWVAWLSA